MKTIGIVGGLAWPSTVVYYQVINELVAKRCGGSGLHCARLVLAQTDFAEIERHQREGRWDLVGDLLAEQGNKLKAAGADFFLVACNTVHTADQRIEGKVDLPFLHIVDATARQVVDRGFRTVGLLGSRYTMTGTYFVGRLQERYGLKVLVAEGEHQDNVHDALYQELAKGILRPETAEKFRAAMADLARRGAEAIILGCTEFGLLVKSSDSPVPIIDTTRAHAEAAVAMAFAETAAAPAGAVTPEQRLKQLGLELPAPPAPAANYIPWRRAGQLLYLSGQGPRTAAGALRTGRLGLDCDLERGYADARQVGFQMLATIRQALGSLDHVAGIVKLLGMVNAEPGFKDHPKVINGCSDLLVEVFGEAGRHARSAVGMGSLPNGITVEVEAIIQVAEGH